MRTLGIGLVSLLALASSSCSEDDDDAPPPFVSGVVATYAPVSTLSSDEQGRLCRSYGAHLSSSVGLDLVAQAVCLPQAILLGGSREGCQRRLSACTSEVPLPVRIDAQLSNTRVCTANLAQCDLTVRELEGCINLRLDWVYELVSDLSCAGAGDPDTRARADAMRGIAVCAGAKAGCQRFIDVDEPQLF